MPKKTKVSKGPPARGTKGLGSVFPDARRGGWRGKLPVGRAGGKTLYREFAGATEAEVVRKMREAAPPGPEVTVAEYAARWLKTLDLAASTVEAYTTDVGRVTDALGALRLAAVTPSEARAALKGWVRPGVGRRQGTSPATANRALAVAQAMFNAAVADRLIPASPFADCPRLRSEPRPMDPFTPAELRAVVAAHALTAPGPLIALLAATGLRVGEACALDVGDYDPAAGKLSVTKTYSQRFGMGPPKSRHGRRTVTVPGPARPALLAAVGARTAGPLFKPRRGTRYNKNRVRVAFRALCRRLGLRYRNPHQLRHGVGCLMHAAGVSIAEGARYLGHSKQVHLATYVRPLGDDPADVLTERLAGDP